MPLRKDNDEERSQRIEEALARAAIGMRRNEASQAELDARRAATEPIGRRHAGSRYGRGGRRSVRQQEKAKH